MLTWREMSGSIHYECVHYPWSLGRRTTRCAHLSRSTALFVEMCVYDTLVEDKKKTVEDKRNDRR